MTVDDFGAFVEAVHGRTPFKWQERLCRKVVAEAGWPETIGVPTGCGKTSAIDIAVFCLALQGPQLAALGGAERWARVRTVFCVDRRLVVDEAFEHAKKIAKALLKADSGILKEVADRLLLYGGERPLKVAKLRGGMYRDDTWADHPNQPLIVLSTVDQTGSRLLFRGYQVSDSQKPVHAGLMGSNTLIIVDEAHLSHAFAGSIRQVQQWRTPEQPTAAPALQLVRMSATPETNEASPFKLLDAEKAEPETAKRIGATKLALLDEASEAQFAAKAAEHARTLGKSVRLVGVVVNQVRTAREIFELLKKDGEREAILLTGRIRPYDRDQLINKWMDHIKVEKVESKSTTKLYVVATQTVEVGANIDFDAMVTECASLASLRQRFGRLHRLGNDGRGAARAVILKRKMRKGSGDDPVYGTALEATWDWLTKLAEGLPGKEIDFGFEALDRFTPPDGVNPPQLEPLKILAAHLDAWIQTNPRPFPEPDVAPFLHSEKASADVQIVWRADLPSKQDAWPEAVLRVPPKVREALPVPFWAVRRWLAEAGKEAAAVSDQEGARGEDEQRDQLRPFVVWRGPDDCFVEEKNLLRPGDTIVAPCSYGGCDEFGWHPESAEPVTDIGTAVAFDAVGGWSSVRLMKPEASGLIEEYRAAFDEDDQPELERLRGEAGERLLEGRKGTLRFAEWADDPGAIVFHYRPPKNGRDKSCEVASDQSDAEDDSSSYTAKQVTLTDHTEHVASKAVELAQRCGLGDEMTRDFRIAARLHDVGKADRRFQELLGANGDTGLLAKSGAKRSPAEERRVTARAGYPRGYRHEFMSVALADKSKLLGEAHDRDLVLHLIGTHHGRGRALAPVALDPVPEEVSHTADNETLRSSSAHGLERLDSGWTERFVRLNRKYGSWGLAYLEAIFRRADCLASSEEAKGDD